MIKGTSILRESNEKRILKLLRDHEAEARQDLVSLTGLGKNTVSVIIDRFLKEGLLEEVGVCNENKVGRPKRIISLIPDAIKEIGVAIESDAIKFSVLNYRLEEKKTLTVAIEEPSNLVAVFHLLEEQINQLLEEFPEVMGIGISVPGIIDINRGVVIKSTQLGWENVPLMAAVRAFFNGIVVVINTVKALSLVNALSDKHSVFYVRVRNGIGGVFIQQGKVTFGNSWIAGEVGQIPLLTEDGTEVYLEEALNANVVRNQMTAGPPAAVLAEKGRLMGRFISSIIFMCNPETILIDAFYCQEAVFQASVENYLAAHISSTLLHETRILLKFFESKLPEQGAALLTIDAFENVNYDGPL